MTNKKELIIAILKESAEHNIPLEEVAEVIIKNIL